MSSESLSDIQKRIYEFIVEYRRDKGKAPTNREIGSAMNIASTGHVDYHLSMLEKKGYITRNSMRSRGIKLVLPFFGIPVMGNIAAGQPLEIFTDPSEAIDIGKEVEQQGVYALVVKGQSMIQAIISDKDYLIMKPQNTCENGDIVVTVHLQGNNCAMLKRFFEEKERDRVRLQSANSEMDQIYIPKSEWDREWQIQGRVLAVFRKLDSRSDVSSLRRIRVFLCHSSGDKDSVRQLYERLKACNHDPWLDEENLLAGKDWENEIRKAVRAADVVIVCLSRDSISKTGFVQKEIRIALDVAEEKPDDTIFIIPLKLEACDIPQRLRRWQCIKYFEQDGFDKLMKTLAVNISV